MISQPRAYALALFCIVIQSGLCLAVKVVFENLGDTAVLSDKLMIYAGSLFLMGIYAVLWQFVLKSLDLSVANSLMSLAPVLTLLGGACFFNEKISAVNAGGFSMIIVGLLLIINSKREKRQYEF